MIPLVVDSVLSEHGPSESIFICGFNWNEPEVSADWSSPLWKTCRESSRRVEERAAKSIGVVEGKPELPFGDNEHYKGFSMEN